MNLCRKDMLYDRCLSYKGFVVPMQINNKGTPVLKAQKMKTRYAFFFSHCHLLLVFNSQLIGKNILYGRWPVPEPYWYHGALDVDRYHVPMLRGRTLH